MGMKKQMRIKLIHGDCLEVMRRIPGGLVDMVCADLPYGKTACKWDSIISLDTLWKEYRRVCKPNAAIVLTADQPFTSILIMSNPKWFKYDWVWSKNKVTGFLNAKKQPLRSHESVLVFYKKQCTYNPQMTEGHKPVNNYTKHTSDGETVGKTKIGISGGGATIRYPRSIQGFSVVNQDGTNDGGNFHSAQKPIALIEYLIKTYTIKGDVVLDNCMGSGTAGVACKNLNRDFIGIELNKKSFNKAKERIINHSLDYLVDIALKKIRVPVQKMLELRF